MENKKETIAELVNTTHIKLRINRLDKLESFINGEIELTILKEDVSTFAKKLEHLIDEYAL